MLFLCMASHVFIRLLDEYIVMPFQFMLYFMTCRVFAASSAAPKNQFKESESLQCKRPPPPQSLFHLNQGRPSQTSQHILVFMHNDLASSQLDWCTPRHALPPDLPRSHNDHRMTRDTKLPETRTLLS